MPIDPTFNTSFIPKKSLQSQAGGGGPYVKRRGTYGPGFFVSSLIFAIALLVSAGLFFYSGTIERSIEGKIQQLELAREALRHDLLAAFEHLDIRLASAKLIVADHRVVTALLEHIEDITLKDARYQEFTYTAPARVTANEGTAPRSANGPDQDQFKVTLLGQADSVESVALQIEQYRFSEYVSDVVLESVDRDITESPSTEFEVTLTLDPRLVAFAEGLQQTNTSDVVSAPEATPIQAVSPDTQNATTTPAEIPVDIVAPGQDQGQGSNQ